MEHMSMSGTKLVVMGVVSFVVMYVLMYMMVNTYGNIYTNLNEFYMAAVMTGAMMLIEVILMKSMYGRTAIISTLVISAVMLVTAFFFLRNQTAISDKEFLRSMIGHHGAALLMCEHAKLQDPEIKNLCAHIVAGQQSEITWMQAKLSSLR